MVSMSVALSYVRLAFAATGMEPPVSAMSTWEVPRCLADSEIRTVKQKSRPRRALYHAFSFQHLNIYSPPALSALPRPSIMSQVQHPEPSAPPPSAIHRRASGR
jgi:hypothetical protein